MLCRHWQVSADFVRRELEWVEFYPMLWICFEQEELARRQAWMGKPEDYKRVFPLPGDDLPQPEMRGAEIGAKVEALAASLGQAPNRVSLEAMAEWRPDLVQAVYAGPDGALVDAEGRPVDVGNRVLVPAEPQAETAPRPPGLPPMIAAALGLG